MTPTGMIIAVAMAVGMSGVVGIWYIAILLQHIVSRIEQE